MLSSSFLVFITSFQQSKYFLLRPNDQSFLRDLRWRLFQSIQLSISWGRHFIRFRVSSASQERPSFFFFFFQSAHNPCPFSWTYCILLYLVYKVELVRIWSRSLLPPLFPGLLSAAHTSLSASRKAAFCFFGFVQRDLFLKKFINICSECLNKWVISWALPLDTLNLLAFWHQSLCSLSVSDHSVNWRLKKKGESNLWKDRGTRRNN